jgi:hypothetical protein
MRPKAAWRVQVKPLEDKPQGRSRSLAIAQRAHVTAIEYDASSGLTVEAADDLEQRRFLSIGGSGDRQKVTVFNA